MKNSTLSNVQSGQLEMNDIEHGLIFYATVPKLQTLASSRFALIIWQNEINDHLITELPSSNQVVEKFHTETISSIPTSLRDLIAKRIKKIRIKLENWLSDPYDGFDRILLSKNYNTWIRSFDKLVWKSDYTTIDYLKTCQNLLRTDQLSDDEKFTMACAYCQEKDIGELWIRAQAKVEVWESLGPPWLLQYWIDRMKHLPDCTRISDTFDQDDMVLNMPLNRWATEYFWPYLNFESQVGCILKIISAQDCNYVKFSLSKLVNDAHLLRILDKEGTFILRTLIENPKRRSLAIPFWNQVKNIFDEHKFFEFVRWMLISEVGGLYCHVLNEKERSLCQQIWSSAPEKLKEYALNYLLVDDLPFKTNVRRSIENSYRSVELLKMVISEAPPEHRSKIWKENWFRFYKLAKSSDANELLELCLDDATERSDFKRSVLVKLDNTEIQEYYFDLLDSMEFSELDEFLRICVTDQEALKNQKQRIIRSYFLDNSRRCPNKYFDRIDDFVALVDETFTDPELASRFKKEFAFSDGCLERLYNVFLYNENFDTIKHLVAVLLSDDKDVEEWKEEFKPSCQHFLSTALFCKFNRSRWQDFMMWYFGTEEKVREFKRSIDADYVFEMLSESYGDKIRRGHKIFDSFLKWRFDSKDEVAAFKNAIASANPEFDDIHRLLFGKRRRRDSVESNSE